MKLKSPFQIKDKWFIYEIDEKNIKSIVMEDNMVSAKTANAVIQKNVLNGAKVPHSTSYPVIRNEGGRYYLAVFTFFYSRRNIEAGSIKRPTIWAIADIETGEIVRKYETKEREFSDASYDVEYKIRSDVQYDTSKEYYEKAFSILDSVRARIINDGKFYKGEYQYYLDRILANIPEAYRRFYTDLSI